MAKGKRVRKRRRDEIMTCRKPRNKFVKHGVKVKIHNHGIWGELEPVRCWEGVGNIVDGFYRLEGGGGVASKGSPPL